MTNDITKHKDWQAWQGALTEQFYYGATENEMLRVLAPLIFAAGQEEAQAEIRVLRQRVADAQDDLGPDWRSDDTEFRNE